MKRTDVIRNPVAKNAAEFCKSRIERDRKKNPSKKQKAQELAERHLETEKPHKLEPYTREQKKSLVNYLLGEWDAHE